MQERVAKEIYWKDKDIGQVRKTRSQSFWKENRELKL